MSLSNTIPFLLNHHFPLFLYSFTMSSACKGNLIKPRVPIYSPRRLIRGLTNLTRSSKPEMFSPASTRNYDHNIICLWTSEWDYSFEIRRLDVRWFFAVRLYPRQQILNCRMFFHLGNPKFSSIFYLSFLFMVEWISFVWWCFHGGERPLFSFFYFRSIVLSNRVKIDTSFLSIHLLPIQFLLEVSLFLHFSRVNRHYQSSFIE